MTARPICTAVAVLCTALAWAAAPPAPAVLREWAATFVRPALLPFAWGALDEARRSGDDDEYFARARQIVEMLPTWVDGHVVFAYRLALGDVEPAGADAGGEALRRLQLALAWLETARADAGPREVELLQAMALLPEVAVGQEPALAERLRPGGGAAALADRCLAEAERLRGSPEVREQRTFLAPKLIGGLLAAGDRAEARAVLATAIARSEEVRDRELAAAWRARLEEVRRWLDGDRTVDLTAVRRDPRFAPLVPHLH